MQAASAIVAYASSVQRSSVVLVIALSMLSGYTVVTTNGKEIDRMAQTRNLCAQLPLDLHAKVCGERERSELTTAQYITNLLTEYYKMKESGGNEVMISGKSRTLAFQIDEDLFQQIKAHLERDTQRTVRKYTQREFVLNLIEEALIEAEEAAAEEAERVNASSASPTGAPTERMIPRRRPCPRRSPDTPQRAPHGPCKAPVI